MKKLDSVPALALARQNRNFRLYIIGMAATGLGVWVQTLAIAWLAWELTRSPAWLGGIALAEAVPALLLALFAGTIVDRTDYMKIMRLTQGFQLGYAITIAVLTFVDYINIWMLCGLTIFRGMALAFARPSRMASLFSIVGRDSLPPALGLQSIVFNASRFIGPALGGLIIVYGGLPGAFAAAALMFALFTVLLAVMNVPATQMPQSTDSIGSATIDGLRYIYAHQGIGMIILLLIAVSLLARPLTEMLPAISDQMLGLGSQGLALLFTAHGFGAMIGAIWFASWKSGGKKMTWTALACGFAISLALALVVVTSIVWIACLAVALAGFSFIVQSIASQSLIQSAVDSRMRGRVMSAFGVVSESVPSLGAFLIGISAEYFGLRPPMLVGALLCLCVTVWAWRRRDRLRIDLEGT